jgi:hypothetical protein
MKWSSQIHAGLLGSGVTWDLAAESAAFQIRGRYPLWHAFPDASLTMLICNSVIVLVRNLRNPATPKQQRHQA